MQSEVTIVIDHTQTSCRLAQTAIAKMEDGIDGFFESNIRRDGFYESAITSVHICTQQLVKYFLEPLRYTLLHQEMRLIHFYYPISML